jgi:hypothetical protein
VIILYSKTLDGHRGAYVDFVSSLMPCERVSRFMSLIAARQPVLFLMIEDSFLHYVVTTLLRSATGRRTVGLLFRPRPAVESGRLRHRLKRATLKLLKRLDSCRTLTILPFSVDPQFATIADGWIYDFQLWDLTQEDQATILAARAARAAEKGRQGISRDISEAAGRRRVVCAIGSQTVEKGFRVFVEAFAAHPEIRHEFLFAFGGTVATALKPLGAALGGAGGVAVDRRITDREILELYGIADLVWAYYDLGYDQASGILGRAAQAGIPVVVREGSLLQKLCQEEGIQHCAVSAGSPGDLAACARMAPDPQRGLERAARFRSHSLAVLRAALS